MPVKTIEHKAQGKHASARKSSQIAVKTTEHKAQGKQGHCEEEHTWSSEMPLKTIDKQSISASSQKCAWKIESKYKKTIYLNMTCCSELMWPAFIFKQIPAIFFSV